MDAEERKKELMAQNKMSGLMFKMDDDPRVTPIGRFMRKTSIDEFPQFINIFKGDMSLVGTRPPTVDEYNQYDQHHKSRLAMKPGLTGMWQVSGRSEITDFEEVVRLDNEYIMNFSISLDIKILIKTVFTVLKRKDRYRLEMTASVGNIVLYILFLWIAPVFVGNAICNRLSMQGTIPRSFVMGYLSMWAVFQIITVPLILLKVSFLVDVVVYSMFLIGIIVYGIVKKTYCSMTIPKVEPSAWVGIIVMLATGIYMIVQSFRLQLTNADDTRFVVNAVDTVRTNRMLLTDVNTGKEILSWTGDLFKDVISPWAVFAAYLSKITGISAASMMHTFLPPVLLAVMMCIFWLVAGELFDKHIYRALFVILLLVMYMYGYFSIYNAETFTIIRLWQGKATMAAVGIPALLYAFLRLYRLLPDDRRWKEKTVYNAEQKEQSVWYGLRCLQLRFLQV